MAEITPIVASLDGDVTNATTTEADSTLKTSALADGVDYLCFWRAQMGGSDGAAVVEGSIRHGTSADVTTGTRLGFAAGEGGEFPFTPNSSNGHTLQGFTKVTGNGSDVLKVGFRCQTASDTASIGKGSIVALPLTDLVEGQDYFFDGSDADTLELENASTSAMQTIRSKTWDIPGDEDWIVGACTEGHPGEGANNESCRVQFTVGGTRLGDAGEGDPFKTEWEDDADWFNYVFFRVMSLSGSTTFLAEGRSENAAESDYRRTRFFALRAGALDQVVQAIDTTGVSTIANSYTNFMTQSYTANQDESVLVLASMVPRNLNTTRRCQLRLRNDTDGVDLLSEVSCHENNPFSGDGKDECPVAMLAVTELPGSVSKTFTIDYRLNGTNGSVGVGRNDDGTVGIESVLIFASLTIPATNFDIEPDAVETALSLPDPTIELTLEVSPAPTSLSLVVPDPTIDRALELAPDAVALALSVTDPQVARILNLTPGAVALALSVEEGAVARGALDVGPQPVPAGLDFPDAIIERQVAQPIAPTAGICISRERDESDPTRDRDFDDESRSN